MIRVALVLYLISMPTVFAQSSEADECKRKIPQACESKLKAGGSGVPNIDTGGAGGQYHKAYCKVKVLAEAFDGCVQDYEAAGLEECALLARKQALALYESAEENKRGYGQITGGQDTSSFTLDCSASAGGADTMKEAPTNNTQERIQARPMKR